MNSKKILIIFGVLLILIISISACGNSNNEADKQQASIQNATDQHETVEQAIAEPDSKENMDSLLGDWIDINAKDCFAQITKVGTDYQYEDNDGKYAGTFKDGILKVKVTDSDTDTADVYIDATTGHMVLVYQNCTTEFEKK